MFPNLKEVLLNSVPVTKFETYNVLTSLDFTVNNFKKVFSATEFWDVLKVSFYYTVFGTAGALLFGVFAALILQKSFPGRPIVRGLMLFPYVAPVIAVAFSWIVLLDPFSGALNAMLIQMDVVSDPNKFFWPKNYRNRNFWFLIQLSTCFNNGNPLRGMAIFPTFISFSFWRVCNLFLLIYMKRPKLMVHHLYSNFGFYLYPSLQVF